MQKHYIRIYDLNNKMLNLHMKKQKIYKKMIKVTKNNRIRLATFSALQEREPGQSNLSTRQKNERKQKK